MKIICSTLASLPTPVPADARAFTFFERADDQNVGGIGNGWLRELEAAGFAPPVPTWDFVLFSFAVCAADFVALRKRTADGWTRELELDITLNDPRPWVRERDKLAEMLRVLTGDFWTLNFLEGGPPPPSGNRVLCDRDCVALLSGGLDSLIGGLDARAQGRRPIFVSQLAHEDTARQVTYANMLGGGTWHQQWSHRIAFKGAREPSTRGRSMAFYGLAVLASSLLNDIEQPEIIVPENGFISVNPPLLPGRMASLSTRTTHPLFMQQLQEVLPLLGVNVLLKMPYRFKTKGEMLAECEDQATLAQFASDTTSCGRFRTYNRTHCGRCVPCMVRKAAFLQWGETDLTTYRFPNLANSRKAAVDDPMAAACAVLSFRANGIDRFLGASLSFSSANDRRHYRRVLGAGLAELGALLERDGLL